MYGGEDEYHGCVVILDDRHVFLHTDQPHIMLYDSVTGRTVYDIVYDMPDDCDMITSHVVSPDCRVVVVCFNFHHALCALDPATGRVLWTARLPLDFYVDKLLLPSNHPNCIVAIRLSHKYTMPLAVYSLHSGEQLDELDVLLKDDGVLSIDIKQCYYTPERYVCIRAFYATHDNTGPGRQVENAYTTFTRHPVRMCTQHLHCFYEYPIVTVDQEYIVGKYLGHTQYGFEEHAYKQLHGMPLRVFQRTHTRVHVQPEPELSDEEKRQKLDDLRHKVHEWKPSNVVLFAPKPVDHLQNVEAVHHVEYFMAPARDQLWLPTVVNVWPSARRSCVAWNIETGCMNHLYSTSTDALFGAAVHPSGLWAVISSTRYTPYVTYAYAQKLGCAVCDNHDDDDDDGDDDDVEEHGRISTFLRNKTTGVYLDSCQIDAVQHWSSDGLTLVVQQSTEAYVIRVDAINQVTALMYFEHENKLLGSFVNALNEADTKNQETLLESMVRCVLLEDDKLRARQILASSAQQDRCKTITLLE